MRDRRPAVRLLLALLLVILALSCGILPASGPTKTPPPEAQETTPLDIPAATKAPKSTDTPVIQPSPTTAPEIQLPPFEQPRFAVYREPTIDTVPSLTMDEVASGLENVHVPFALSETQLARLAADGFVVSPGAEKEFFTLYEKARYSNVPIFVTSDSLLHVYHLLFDKVLRTAEVAYFIPLLHELNAALLSEAGAAYQDLRGTPWEDAALRTVAFVAVAGRLANPAFPVPPYAQALVDGELANIESAAGMLPSPIFPGLTYGEDYTQYIPRGHYTRSEALKAYFKSMMWYGRMTFRLRTDDPEVGRAETRSALLLVRALRQATAGGRPALDLWQDLYSPTVFFVGRSDDLTVLQYGEVMDAVYGPDAVRGALSELADDAKLDAFIDLADQLPPPKILGIV
ncbi:MAG: DUF3160 domain-containing protein, partial [Anaerolineae bacterium]|nr:DUF3160 domain-containing protein [Anaerolineae bacterium]